LREVPYGDVRVTLTALERRFLMLLRESGLELPNTNRRAGGRRVDCRWPKCRLSVELDGYRDHHSRHAWEQDRRREREARRRTTAEPPVRARRPAPDEAPTTAPAPDAAPTSHAEPDDAPTTASDPVMAPEPPFGAPPAFEPPEFEPPPRRRPDG